jgi:hypothetical protein
VALGDQVVRSWSMCRITNAAATILPIVRGQRLTLRSALKVGGQARCGGQLWLEVVPLKPPVGRKLLRDNTVRVHRAIRTAGVDAQLHFCEGQAHAQYLAAPESPGTTEIYGEIAAFLAKWSAP